MTAAPGALAFEVELPAPWVAVDLTDPHWRPALARALDDLWSDPKVTQYRQAIESSSAARVELMADQGAACLLVGSYQPTTTVLGAIFIRPAPTDGFAPVFDRFIRASWRTTGPVLNGITTSMFSREINVPGLVGLSLIERIVALPLGETLISLAFTSAIFGAAAELLEGVNATDRGIEELLKKISW
ncbi:MAG: hypothetical protein JWM76_1329 [Pseudonocardiales bacterium]|nr:hypothetical protein [Pseudonocardiales bacterium]